MEFRPCPVSFGLLDTIFDLLESLHSVCFKAVWTVAKDVAVQTHGGILFFGGNCENEMFKVLQSLFPSLLGEKQALILMTNRNKTRGSSEQKFSHTLHSLCELLLPPIFNVFQPFLQLFMDF